ncbi:hypothetical protein HPB51_025116 [Rhipicephalus microplus]|uniref:Ig-like domain-containing protein n=1 Tax=Rhipicephalus microplus TaxID=6941 RepID=A0A9J6DR91_RHIMP|nr:hypothetical protein HPB51_025116 [Rhipicephalus microplus]
MEAVAASRQSPDGAVRAANATNNAAARADIEWPPVPRLEKEEACRVELFVFVRAAAAALFVPEERQILGLCRAVTIRRLIVPRWVRNGTDTPVVLDCEYVYNENDLKLVVKWFFNDGAEPVYQWIPEMRVREAFGVLQGRLDDTFSVSSRDMYSQYRAIRIMRPTWELSGKYTCVVTSLAGQDARHQDMTVFVPARSFSFNYSSAASALDEQVRSRSAESTVRLLCVARGTYPRPDLKLYLIRRGARRAAGDVGIRTYTTATIEDGLFDVALHADMNEGQLSMLADLFECVLEIPYSNYVLTRKMSLAHGREDLTSVSAVQRHCRTFENLKTRRIAPKFSRLANVTMVASVVVSPSADLAATIRAIVREELQRQGTLADDTIHHPPTCSSYYPAPFAPLPSSVCATDFSEAGTSWPRRGSFASDQRYDRRFRTGPVPQRPAVPVQQAAPLSSGRRPYPAERSQQWFGERPLLSATTVASKATLPGHFINDMRTQFSGIIAGSVAWKHQEQNKVSIGPEPGKHEPHTDVNICFHAGTELAPLCCGTITPRAERSQPGDLESWEALLCSPDPNVQRDIISEALAAATSQGIPADS